MLYIKATDEEVRHIAANAVNASSPMGLGFVHYKADHVFHASEFSIDDRFEQRVIQMDYVEGRMVKLNLQEEGKKGSGIWSIRAGSLNPDYQSWATKYPTAADLVASVGSYIPMVSNLSDIIAAEVQHD